MTIIKLIKAKEVLMPIFQQKLSPKLSYKIMKFVSKIELEETFYDSKLKDIIDKYGAKDAEGKLQTTEDGIRISEGKQDECKQALAELDSVEVIPPEIRFSLDELSEIKLSAIDMFKLADFIDEDK